MSLVHAAMPYLTSTEDGLRHILICSSAASKMGVPQMGVYSATKASQDSIASARMISGMVGGSSARAR